MRMGLSRPKVVAVALVAAIIAIGAVLLQPARSQLPPKDSLGFCTLSPTVATALSSCTGGNPASYTGGVPPGTGYALVNIETGNVRWLDTGTAPTASVGMVLYAGSYWGYSANQLSKLQFIAQTGSATPALNITFYAVGSP